MNLYDVEAIMEKSKIKMYVWLAIAIIASIISIISYNNAVDNGGSYVIWTGGIIVGAINFFRFLAHYRKCKKIISEYYSQL